MRNFCIYRREFFGKILKRPFRKILKLLGSLCIKREARKTLPSLRFVQFGLVPLALNQIFLSNFQKSPHPIEYGSKKERKLCIDNFIFI